MTCVEVQMIPLDRIHWAKNVRTVWDEAAVAALAQTLAEEGLQQPITVMRGGNGYVGVLGYRRFLATRKAGDSSIAAIVLETPPSEAEIASRQLIENNQREDLNPMDLAAGLDLLIKSGLSASEVAAKQGMSGGTVSRSLALLSLPEPIRALVSAGKLPASSAYELSKVQDAKLQMQWASQLASGELTRDRLSGKLKSLRAGSPDGSAKKLSRVSVPLADSSVAVAAPNLTLDTFINSLEHVLSEAKKSRSRGIILATFVRTMKDLATSKQ